LLMPENEESNNHFLSSKRIENVLLKSLSLTGSTFPLI
jgi:hypothetical protein